MEQKIISLLTNQVNKEFYSAYFYLDIANYYDFHNLKGFSNWFRVQAQEERDHAILFSTYLLNNGQAVKLGQIDAPAIEFKDFRQPLIATLEHEKYVTSLINNIYGASMDIKDFRTIQFLDWFIKEQGEEEKNSDDLIKRYDLFGNDKKALYMLDSELASRVYAPPTLII